MLVIQRPTVEAVDEEDGNLQRFAISPLEPGFGHTLGNSLRRTLLSSIPGAAITQVRFDDALHEFDTISGVTEDVTDVILNPELHIATVSGDGQLAVDLTIERGKGYLSGSGRETPTIGVIPIDAIFSPIRRVTFSVEPTRVEQSTNYDRLVLEVETDGSMTPREALSSAGATLRELVGLVADMTDEPEGLTLTEATGPVASSPDLDRLIEELDLSERPRNCLKRAQVNTIGELLTKSEDDLLAITNFGQKSLDEVIEKLDEWGMSLRGRD